MDVVNYSEFRKKLKSNLDKVSDTEEVVIISRSQNKNVVLLSLREYNSLNETIHLASSEKNRLRINEALQEMANGGFVKKDLLSE